MRPLCTQQSANITGSPVLFPDLFLHVQAVQTASSNFPSGVYITRKHQKKKNRKSDNAELVLADSGREAAVVTAQQEILLV